MLNLLSRRFLRSARGFPVLAGAQDRPLDFASVSDQTGLNGTLQREGPPLSTDLGACAMSEEPAIEAGEEEHHASAHDEALVEEWEDESFPASDPPSNY